MSKKRPIGVVYSTAADFEYQYEEAETAETLPPSGQDLRVMRDSKGRGCFLRRGNIFSEW